MSIVQRMTVHSQKTLNGSHDRVQNVSYLAFMHGPCLKFAGSDLAKERCHEACCKACCKLHEDACKNPIAGNEHLRITPLFPSKLANDYDSPSDHCHCPRNLK